MKNLAKVVQNRALAARDWVGAAGRRSALAATLQQAFDWAYGKAVDGMPGVDGAAAIAARYSARNASTDAAVAELIAWQSGVAGVAGFLTGCGGFVALP